MLSLGLERNDGRQGITCVDGDTQGSVRRDSRMSSDIQGARDPVNIAEGLEDYAG